MIRRGVRIVKFVTLTVPLRDTVWARVPGRDHQFRVLRGAPARRG
jgi:hypothetical protein